MSYKDIENSRLYSKINMFSILTEKFGLLDNEIIDRMRNVISYFGATEEATETYTKSSLDQIRQDCEFMAKDVLGSFGDENAKNPPNKYCKTLRRTVKEISDKHDLVFKGIVNKLRPNADNALQTFVVVADELFDVGPVNWGRLVALYAFASYLANYVSNNNDTCLIEKRNHDNSHRETLKKNIADCVGKYVANKLGQWILDHGGWDAFVEYFPEQHALETRIFKVGLLTAFGLGALALAAKR